MPSDPPEKPSSDILSQSFFEENQIKEKDTPSLEEPPTLLEEDHSLLPGELILQRYLIDKELGRGGMGKVFRAFDQKEKRLVALKMLFKMGQEEKIRFQREYRFLRIVEHPNLIKAYDYFEEEGKLFMVLEFVAGRSLAQILDDGKIVFSLPEQLSIANKITRAIEILNMGGVLHRDMKPGNVMINVEDGTVKVLDLGLGKDLSGDLKALTAGNHILGTLSYLSPEQLTGKSHRLSDMFSLGTMLYQFFLWSKDSPFYDRNSLVTVYKIGHHNPEGLDKVLLEKRRAKGEDFSPEEEQAYRALSALLEKAMAKEPEKRCLASEMADAFAELQQVFLQLHYSVFHQKLLPLSRKLDSRLMENLAQIQKTEDKKAPASLPPTALPLRKKEEFEKWEKKEKNAKSKRSLSDLFFTGKEKIVHLNFLLVFLLLVSICFFCLVFLIPSTDENIPEKTSKTSILRKNISEKRKTMEERTDNTFPKITGFKFSGVKSYHCAEKSYEVAEYLHLETSLEFTLLEGGRYLRGSEQSPEEGPVQEVTIPSFLISRHEVPQKVWRNIMGGNPSRFFHDDRPVENISWQDSLSFCKKTGLELPSEAQWEYACRGGVSSDYYWGEAKGEGFAWYTPQKNTAIIGKRKPNAFGLYDMSGNVWEWCADAYYSDYQGAPNDGSARQATGNNLHRVVRGGSWNTFLVFCRSSFRFQFDQNSRLDHIGFRVVKTIDGE